MKSIAIAYILVLCLVSCTQTTTTPVSDGNPKTSVTLTKISYGKIRNEITLSATTAYQNKSTITAPIASFIVKVYVRPGSIVQAGQTLYEIQSKEAQAFADTPDYPVKKSISVKAGISGIVTSVLQQQGSFVSEGTSLCTIAGLNSLVFELNVPYEQIQFAKPGKKCILVLPDNTRLNATIQTPLNTMNTVSQVQQITSHAQSSFLPEGLTLKAIIDTDTQPGNTTIILPKSAVQSDDMLTSYWIMKLANDSMAVKVPVTIGNSNIDSIEILSPSFSPTDRIVNTGGYALADGSLVIITK